MLLHHISEVTSRYAYDDVVAVDRQLVIFLDNDCSPAPDISGLESNLYEIYLKKK